MPKLSELRDIVNGFGAPLRLTAVVRTVGPSSRVPATSGPGLTEQMMVHYSFPMDDEVEWFVYEFGGKLEYWTHNKREGQIERRFAAADAADMARFCFLWHSALARKSMGLPRITLTPYAFDPTLLPDGYSLVCPPGHEWLLTEISSGAQWSADRSDSLVDFAIARAYTPTQLVSILASPTGEPLARTSVSSASTGWNDDGTAPYSAAYNVDIRPGSKLGDLRLLLDNVAKTLRIATRLRTVAPSPRVPAEAGTGPIAQLEIDFGFGLARSEQWFVYDVGGTLQFWSLTRATQSLVWQFSTEDPDVMARHCLVIMSHGARASCGLHNIVLVPEPLYVDALPKPFVYGGSAGELVHIFYTGTGTTWRSNNVGMPVVLARSMAYRVEQLAEILMSPTGLPMAVATFTPLSAGWNDDGTSPYNYAYNARLLYENPELY